MKKVTIIVITHVYSYESVNYLLYGQAATNLKITGSVQSRSNKYDDIYEYSTMQPQK